jgi:CMP-N,N'-diacetyllegionaminic acid synthase
MLKILAVIPARGGSKRLPRKNIKLLGGKPLINWSIDTAKEISEICSIVVSTDDEEIAAIAKKAGATVPWLRPAELSSDESKSADVAIHALNWYQLNYGNVDGLLLLQPTSPFRTTSTIKTGIEIFREKSFKPVLGVKPCNKQSLWILRNDKENLEPLLDFLYPFKSSNKVIKEIYEPSGNFYLISPADLISSKSFMNKFAYPLIPSQDIEYIDIDTLNDFEKAEAIISDRNDYKNIN